MSKAPKQQNVGGTISNTHLTPVQWKVSEKDELRRENCGLEVSTKYNMTGISRPIGVEIIRGYHRAKFEGMFSLV